MDFNNTDKLLETIKSFVIDLKEIENITDQRTLAMVERRAVHKLQLAQVEVEMAGRDLYSAVNRRRGQIRRGDIYEDAKSDDARGSKPKSSRATKRSNR